MLAEIWNGDPEGKIEMLGNVSNSYLVHRGR